MTPTGKPMARRGTVLLMIVGLLAMLFIIVSAYIVLARFDRQTLGLAGRGARVTEIISSINDVAAAAIRAPSGGDLVTGENYAQIPGYRSGAWLASPEPVRDPTSTTYLPEDYRYPAVSSFTGGSAGSKRLTDLMVDADGSGDPNVVPGNPANVNADTRANARQPFMDAAGTGISDSYFGGVAKLTELANAMAGKPVRAEGIDPSKVGDPNLLTNTNGRMWEHFDLHAQYAVAARIVSHGGMVQVSAPPNNPNVPWNGRFIAGMFNWVRAWRNNLPEGSLLDPQAQLDLLRAMGAESPAIEPLLRRRGGLLGSFSGSTAAGMPEPLWEFQDPQNPNRYPRTFNPYYDPQFKADNWQRFNLASLDEWNLFRRAVLLDADWYADPGSAGLDLRNFYVPRQLLTTVNSSDELARVQVPPARKDPNSPEYDLNMPAVGVYPGQLKYYLGRITDPNDGAFDWTNGRFIASSTRGFRVVRELADYFGEMLAGYKGWSNESSGATEAVTRKEQAYMLAVNTIAFAAPHDPNGDIDTPWYPDPNDPRAPVYVGYTPQPFITQVLVYNRPESDPNDPNTIIPRVALAVELYNPYDPSLDPNAPQGLSLSRFAVSINDQFDPPGAPLEPNEAWLLSTLEEPKDPVTTGRLPGRRFIVFSINEAGNPLFEPLMHGKFTRHVPYTTGTDKFKVKLWRVGGPGIYLVDEVDVDMGHAGGASHSPSDEWYVNVKRDTGYEQYLGRWNSTGEHARWRMVMANDPNDITADPNQPDATVLADLGVGDGSPSSDPNRPCVPLYTMNANLGGPAYVHGAWRPASFPTVGFMLFVPRLSHMTETVAGVTTRKPVTWMLYEQRQKLSGLPPADFGHMPIFDNNQKVVTSGPNSSDFADNRTGRVPWGLLVFDYFTTLDPNAPGVDPYRVPGRININTAPWYVLAGLPVIGPSPNDANLPVAHSAAPAFWSPASGVLVGTGADATPRFPGGSTTPLAQYDSSAAWWRLGMPLAQAAAAYRDRLAYVQGSVQTAPFAYAYARNNSAGAQYRPSQYGSMRGDTDDPNSFAAVKRGFLTVGELANVMGFDSSPSGLLTDPYNSLVRGDFMKAASLLALLDTHFLTTRSNTFTIYVTLADRQNPQASVRSQMTVDRSNLLPRLIWQDLNNNGIQDPEPTDHYITLQNNGEPEVIGEREVSYYNARYDE